MFEQKELNLKIDTKEFEAKIVEAIVQEIKERIVEILKNDNKWGRDSLCSKIELLFKRAIKEIIAEESRTIRQEVKQEVIERAVKNITELDKKELLKGLLK